MPIPFSSEIIRKFYKNKKLQGQGSLGGFAYNIDCSVPYIATAIHAGCKVRDELLKIMKITSAERYYEEDPETDTMIQSAASSVWGLDSRCEYDLNRPKEDAIPLSPHQFWGTEVYSQQPTDKMIQTSLSKYEQFYLFMGSWAKFMIDQFGICVVYDFHSFNISRQKYKGIKSPPIFNVGTGLLKRKYWAKAIDEWIDKLKNLSLGKIKVTVSENEVFYGKGNLCREMNKWDQRLLVLPTEIAKIYMDENEGTIDRKLTGKMGEGLSHVMKEHSNYFLKNYSENKST